MKQYNPSISSDANRIFNLKMGDMALHHVNEHIQPVVELRRVQNVVKGAAFSTSSASIISAAETTGKDFYVTAATLTYSKKSDCDATDFNIYLTPEGQSSAIRLLTLPSSASIQQNDSVSISIPYPGIKLAPGSTGSVSATLSVGTYRFGYSLVGYTVETTRNGVN